MSENCNHDCSSCGTTCGEDTRKAGDMFEQPNDLSKIRHTIAVVSGKGGVGKSMVTGLLSIAMARKGRHVGIMDADITGPSIPKMFGVKGEVRASEAGAFPVPSAGGIDVVSMNLFLEHSTDPVVWRGPVISGVVKQFWSDIIWNDVDYLFIDMPPGTGDVPLTVMQSIKLDGIVIVTSPQELVSMIVSKAVKMASAMNVPILGLVENMSYFECPDCGKRHEIFGKSHLDDIAREYDLKVLGRIPMQPNLAVQCDAGQIESVENIYLNEAAEELLKLEENK